jgi:hypothetical protein
MSQGSPHRHCFELSDNLSDKVPNHKNVVSFSMPQGQALILVLGPRQR